LRYGQLKQYAGSTHDAINAFFRVLKLDESRKEPNELLGDAFDQLGDQTKSLKWYRVALKASPDNGDICFKLALGELKISGPRAAIHSLNKAVALAEKKEPPPKWLPEAIYRLGSAHEATGSKDSAKRAYKRYRKVAPENHIDRPEVEARLEGLSSGM
jgi:tetratricopeptide (TPR) repeat protein